MRVVLAVLLLAVCAVACQKPSANPTFTVLQQVDAINEQLLESGKAFDLLVQVDHHRLADAEGVYTPPSMVSIWSVPQIQTPLVSHDQRVGLDMPLKVLVYAEADTTQAEVAFTSADFIAKRHDLEMAMLKGYQGAISEIVAGVHDSLISNSELESVGPGFGIIEFNSDLSFDATIEALKNIVQSQDDTQWFAEIDFQKDADSLGVAMRPTTLLLFGAPTPGAMAMRTTPKIGLDAFCQKLLVYQRADGSVWIAFNDIVAFSELYYGLYTKPQKVVNERLKQTFLKAIRSVQQEIE